MTTLAELQAIAARAIPTEGATDIVGVVDVSEGGKLSNGCPSGDDVVTRYGVAWFDGLSRSSPIAWFDQGSDARRLIALLKSGSAPGSGPRSQPSSGSRPDPQLLDRGPVPGTDPAIGRPVVASALPGPRPDAGIAVLGLGSERAGGAVQDAPPIDTHSRPGPEPLGVTPIRSAAAPGATVAGAGGQADGDSAGSERAIAAVASPGRTCKACGRGLDELPPSHQLRQTCNDACRQAFKRGHRAPGAGVVDVDELARVSRLAGPPPRHVRDQRPAAFN
jgi:hypothetical protein